MKTKKLTKIAGVVTLLACIWGGVSCEQNLPEEKTYTVTFDSDGGSEIKPVPVKDGEKVTKPEADPTKDGYTFKGWFNGDTEYDFETAVTANITLKAKWEVVVVNYKVTFDSDGGSEVAAVEVKDGEKVTKPAADPTKTGYTFKGWFIGDKDYDFEKAVTANITLKAKWEVVTYTVKFDSDGGSVVESAKVNHGEKVKKPEDPTKTGYTFKGWLNGETVYDFETAVTADITLKAKWEVVTYTVTFNSDGGSVVESAVVKDGEKVKKPEDPTKTGYTFKGWLNGETVYDFEKAVTADITLKAKWEVVTYNITYELDGGTGYEGNPKTYTIETDDITIKDPVSGPAETPNFAGWYSDKDCVKPADTTIKKGSTGNLSFYAKWSDKSIFTVTFDSNGDSDVEPVKVEDGGKVPKPADPTRTGYTFKGWLNGDTEYNFDTAVKADITLKAKWEVMTYTVTFDSGVTSQTIKYNGTAEEPTAPTKDGYDFVGWYEADGTKFDFATKITKDISLTAKWEEITFTVTFDSGVTSQTIKYNGTATEPTAPTKEGFNFVGWYEGDTKFDFATKIIKNISLTAKWEEKKATEPETPAIPTTVAVTKNEDGSFSFADGTYTFVLDGSSPVLKFSMPEEVSCTIGDKLKLTGKINFGDTAVYKQFYIQTNDTAGVPLFGYNMLAEWNNGLSGDQSLSLSQTIPDTYCKSFKDCKFVLSNPMTEGDKTLINIELKDVVITYEIPDPNAEEVIFDTPQEEPGNVDFTINQAKFDEYIAAGKKTIVFTVKNTADESRGGWGCLAFASQETSGAWTCHNIVENTDLGTNQWGQISFASLDAGATAEKELSIELLKKAVTDLGETNQLFLQTSNKVILQSIKIK